MLFSSWSFIVLLYDLQIVEKTLGPGIALSKESFAEAKSKLEALDKKDAERRRTAELKNNLEAYIYATKEKVGVPKYSYFPLPIFYKRTY